ncbi:MAG: GAF domain-containing protein, partial [Leptospiraceae bacterium]|nr:GAF domain-containing protein [Leptospiraceae bacterium]
AFELHLEAIQSLYLTARYQEAEALFVTVHKRARSPLDQARLYTICVVMYTNMGRHREAIRMGIHGLRHLRYGLSEDPGVIRILANVLRLRMRRRGKSIEEIAHLPRMQDPRLLAIMDLLMAIVPSAFFIHQNLFALIVLRMVRLSVQFGNVNESAYGYLTYGVLLITAFQNIDRARAYSKVAMRLMESSGPTGLECRMHVVYGSFINHWIDNIKYNSKYLRKAFREGLESGDNVYAGYALANRIFASVVKDDTLDEQDRLARTFLRFTDRTGDRDVENDFLLVLQANRNLRGLTHVTDSFNDSEYDEHTHINEMRDGNPVTLCWFYLLKMQNLYILGHYAHAWQAVQTLSKIIEPAQALVIGPEFIFFRGLIAARLAENQIRTGIWQMSGFFYRRHLRISIRQYEKWTRYSPATFGHKLELLKAEHYRLIGRDRPAIAAYSEACRLAGLRNALRVRAIVGERAGQYYSEQTAEDLAVGYLRGAYRDYLNWGALLKVQQLETQYNRYNLSAHVPHAQSITTDSSSTGNAEQSGPQKLDVAAIAMSARALSREIVLDRLLARLMEILLLQSGGRRGFFIRNNGTEYRVEAGGDMERNPRITIESRPLENHPDLPVSVVQYVINTNESLVLVNAGESLFKDDAYIKSRRIRSLLCMPVMLHGKPSGILYLENNLTAGTFTPDRLEVLSILSAQAAVSLENALMYAGLEQQVAERTQEVQHTLEKVQNLKVQQDSDYYLTSLLVQPLARISVTNERIQVRGLVHQKKQFQYKKWSEQIGGDVCIARDITLQDRDCVVFISADAMGKSLQGAGGVLVLGSVFESIISGVGAYEEIARLAPA